MQYIQKQDLEGTHVCRHMEGTAAMSGDQYGEQTYIREVHRAGGLNATPANPEQVVVLIESIVFLFSHCHCNGRNVQL